MPVQLLAIARNTLVESLRQPVFLLLILLCGALQVLTTWSTGFSMGYEDSSEVSGDNKLLLDIGLSSIFLFTTLMAAFVASAVISREIENKTVLTIVSKPVARPTVIVGKFLGVSGAILIAAVTMLCFLLLSIRHGVMTTAADEIDQPVLVFSLGLGFLALAMAAWCNFYYSWNFPQTAVTFLAPAMVLAYVLVLLVSKKWEFQPIGKDFKPQIMMGCAATIFATMVLTAVATAASARLGQVMTIVICMGVLVGSLLTNYFIGRHAFRNEVAARIVQATPVDPARTTFRQEGDRFSITLDIPPKAGAQPGAALFYGPNPNGFDLAVPRPVGDQPAVVIEDASSQTTLMIRNQAADPTTIARAPRDGDLIFLTPTKVNAAAVGLWALLPNLQHFWLLDAISQNQRIPVSHVGLLALYSLFQVTAILSLAVVLFQRRDVG